MHNFNTLLFTVINAGAGQYVVLDWVFIFVTSYILYTVLLVVGLYVVFYMPFRIPKGPLQRQSLWRAAQILCSVASTYIAVSIIKVIVALPRPFEVLDGIIVLAPESGTSFPSGHSAVAMALATSVYFYYPRLGKLLFAFALIVGLSRIFVGVHYPLDVAAGLLLGYVVPKCIDWAVQKVRTGSARI